MKKMKAKLPFGSDSKHLAREDAVSPSAEKSKWYSRRVSSGKERVQGKRKWSYGLGLKSCFGSDPSAESATEQCRPTQRRSRNICPLVTNALVDQTVGSTGQTAEPSASQLFFRQQVISKKRTGRNSQTVHWPPFENRPESPSSSQSSTPVAEAAIWDDGMSISGLSWLASFDCRNMIPKEALPTSEASDHTLSPDGGIPPSIRAIRKAQVVQLQRYLEVDPGQLPVVRFVPHLFIWDRSVRTTRMKQSLSIQQSLSIPQALGAMRRGIP